MTFAVYSDLKIFFNLEFKTNFRLLIFHISKTSCLQHINGESSAKHIKFYMINIYFQPNGCLKSKE